MWSQRAVVDYSLQRRAFLRSLRVGASSTTDACDADRYLVLAAKHHGIATDRTCPICREPSLPELNYVYGDELGPFQGRVKAPRELEAMAHQHGEFRVYVVEVCPKCSWNYLLSSYLLGDGEPRKPLKARRGDAAL